MGSDRERVVSTQRPTAVQSFFPFSQPAPTPPRDCPVINGPSPFDIRLLQPRDKRTGIADTPRQLRRSVPPDDRPSLMRKRLMMGWRCVLAPLPAPYSV